MSNKKYNLPCDKGILARCIIVGSLAKGVTTLSDVVVNEDIETLLNILSSMSVPINVNQLSNERYELKITGLGINGFRIPKEPIVLPVDFNSEVLALLLGICVGQDFKIEITTSLYTFNSEIQALIDVLKSSGANINVKKKKSEIKITTTPSKITGIHYDNNLNSSVIKSGLLLAGLYSSSNFTIKEPNPTNDHTERLLSIVSGNIQKTPTFNKLEMFITETAPINISNVSSTIPIDLSYAFYILSLGILGKYNSISIDNVSINPTRNMMLEIARDMGAEISATNIIPSTGIGEPVATLTSEPASLVGIDINENVSAILEDIPSLCLLFAFAKGESRILNVHSLRLLKSDLIEEIISTLKALGIEATCEVYKKPDSQISESNSEDLFDKYEEQLIIYGNPELLKKRNHNIIKIRTTNPKIALMYEIGRFILGAGISYNYKEIIEKEYPLFYTGQVLREKQ